MAVNFQALLSKPADEVKKPGTKPAGTYFGNIMSYKYDESKKEKTPFVRLTMQGINPGDDVDQALLAGDAETGPIDLSKWKPHKDYYLTDDAMYRLKDLIESCDIETKGRSFAELIPELVGKSVQFTAVQTPSQDGANLYTNVGDMSGSK